MGAFAHCFRFLSLVRPGQTGPKTKGYSSPVRAETLPPSQILSRYLRRFSRRARVRSNRYVISVAAISASRKQHRVYFICQA